MNDVWKTFLHQHGATFENGRPIDFGHAEAERRARADGDLLVDLSDFSLLRVHGADAKTFLNAQLTNDLALLTPERSQLSAWCSAQGRMLVVFQAAMRDGEYLLQLPHALRDDVLKRLRMYVMRAKATFEVLDDTLVPFGLCGPNAATLLREALGTIPETDDAVKTMGGVTIIRQRGIQPRFEIISPTDEAKQLWTRLAAKAQATGNDAWWWHDIQAGLPAVFPATSDAFVPQMANLELVEGVNFKKGCYPGQEIVARVQYLGRLKQRMYRAHVNADAPVPGTPLYTAPDQQSANQQSANQQSANPQSTNPQSIGTVVMAQAAPQGGSDLLAVIQIAIADSAGANLHLATPDGPALALQTLPYRLSA